MKRKKDKGLSISTAFQRISTDDGRKKIGFDPSFVETSDKLLAATDDTERARVLGDWLKTSQPCIFGHLAVERGLIEYCFISEEHLTSTDEDICAIIRTARDEWRSLARHGLRSAFVILALGRRVFEAKPDEALQELALALCAQYLRVSVQPDRIYNDTIELLSLKREPARRWNVGVNFFGAQGDRRWWNDHRIPGGIGFSMNSVGHLVASETRRRAVAEPKPEPTSRLAAKRARAERELAESQQTSVRSLPVALKYAMHTIRGASVGNEPTMSWGPATMLLRASPDLKRCPFEEVVKDRHLGSVDHVSYAGWYHTDITVPSEYFRSDWTKPADIRSPFRLDFSYLHRKGSADYKELAEGRPVPIKTTIRQKGLVGEEEFASAEPPMPKRKRKALAVALRARLEEWDREDGVEPERLFERDPELFHSLATEPDLFGDDKLARRYIRKVAAIARRVVQSDDYKAVFMTEPSPDNPKEGRAFGTAATQGKRR
jgi:hypothetical protein